MSGARKAGGSEAGIGLAAMPAIEGRTSRRARDDSLIAVVLQLVVRSAYARLADLRRLQRTVACTVYDEEMWQTRYARCFRRP